MMDQDHGGLYLDQWNEQNHDYNYHHMLLLDDQANFLLLILTAQHEKKNQHGITRIMDSLVHIFSPFVILAVLSMGSVSTALSLFVENVALTNLIFWDVL